MIRCIVVADDDPTIISLVKLRLGLARFNVFSTGDATAAVAMVHANEPVAVILDVQMPGGGGLSALRRIKADPQMKNLPVMILSGERDAETVMAAMSGGANDYMVKPFDPDTLLERISRLVKSSAMVWGEPAPAFVPAAVWEL
ncbi:MAG: histidine kinase [Alphaproteobacteria bacterium]|nr:histidine kinase [Alphaproteobacteria bacterium]